MDDFVRGLQCVRVIAQSYQRSLGCGNAPDAKGYHLAWQMIIDFIDAKLEDLANQETRYEPNREI